MKRLLFSSSAFALALSLVMPPELRALTGSVRQDHCLTRTIFSTDVMAGVVGNIPQRRLKDFTSRFWKGISENWTPPSGIVLYSFPASLWPSPAPTPHNASIEALRTIRERLELALDHMTRSAESQRKVIDQIRSELLETMDGLQNQAARGILHIGDWARLSTYDSRPATERLSVNRAIFILPGTFDPAHFNHILVLLKALNFVCNRADTPLSVQVILLPSGDKQTTGTIELWKPDKMPLEHRLEMAQHIVDIFSPLIKISSVASEQPANSGADNIVRLMQLYVANDPAAPAHTTLYVVRGSDNFNRWGVTEDKVIRQHLIDSGMRIINLVDEQHDEPINNTFLSRVGSRVTVLPSRSIARRSSVMRAIQHFALLPLTEQHYIASQVLYTSPVGIVDVTLAGQRKQLPVRLALGTLADPKYRDDFKLNQSAILKALKGLETFSPLYISCVEDLEQLLKSNSIVVRARAAILLNQLAWTEAPSLAAYYRTGLDCYSGAWTHRVSDLGDAALPALESALGFNPTPPRRLNPSYTPMERNQWIDPPLHNLIAIGTPAAKDVVLKALASHSKLAEACADVLTTVGGLTVARILVHGLQSDDPNVRGAVQEYLRHWVQHVSQYNLLQRHFMALTVLIGFLSRHGTALESPLSGLYYSGHYPPALYQRLHAALGAHKRLSSWVVGGILATSYGLLSSAPEQVKALDLKTPSREPHTLLTDLRLRLQNEMLGNTEFQAAVLESVRGEVLASLWIYLPAWKAWDFDQVLGLAAMPYYFLGVDRSWVNVFYLTSLHELIGMWRHNMSDAAWQLGIDQPPPISLSESHDPRQFLDDLVNDGGLSFHEPLLQQRSLLVDQKSAALPHDLEAKNFFPSASEHEITLELPEHVQQRYGLKLKPVHQVNARTLFELLSYLEVEAQWPYLNSQTEERVTPGFSLRLLEDLEKGSLTLIDSATNFFNRHINASTSFNKHAVIRVDLPFKDFSSEPPAYETHNSRKLGRESA